MNNSVSNISHPRFTESPSHFSLSLTTKKILLLSTIALTAIAIVGGLTALTVLFPHIMLPVLAVGAPLAVIGFRWAISPSAAKGILALLDFVIHGFEKKPV